MSTIQVFDVKFLMSTTQTTQTTETKPCHLLELGNLSKQFEAANWAVQDFNLCLNEGELICVVGPSGCGKTTLLRMIGGFENIDDGWINLRGQCISRPGWSLPPERRGVGMVFQEYALFPHLSVKENIRFGLKNAKTDKNNHSSKKDQRQKKSQACHSMLSLANLNELAERLPHQISGGQQQRTALARALAPKPDVLLLDEPFSNLDANLRRRLRSEVKHILKESATTAILVTHDQEEAINIADRMVVMNKGKLEQIATPSETLRRPANPFVAGFFGMECLLKAERDGQFLRTELGRFPVPPNLPLEGNYQVLVPPSSVHLRTETWAVRATVHEAGFLGGLPSYTFRLASGQRIRAILPHCPTLRPDDQVGISFTPDPLVVYVGQETFSRQLPAV